MTPKKTKTLKSQEWHKIFPLAQYIITPILNLTYYFNLKEIPILETEILQIVL